jgi:hypothetical protein
MTPDAQPFHDAAPIYLCADPDEAERLALRDLRAICPASDAPTPTLQEYRGARVLVTPRGRRERFGVAAVLNAMGCEVHALDPAFSVEHTDPAGCRSEPMFPNVPDAGGTPAGWPAALDLRELAGREPEAPRFVLRDWLPAGYATLLAGHGGIGKSAIGLHLAVCVALGVPFFGIDTERRRVLYLSCEDRENVLHWRLTHICAHLGIGLAELHGALGVLDLVGHDTVLWDRDPRTGATFTPAYGLLDERIARTRAQLLVVDGVSDTFAGNENARPDVKRYVNALLALLPLDGALLLLGHVNRPAAANPATSEGYSGSTQWHNAVRARWYLYPETGHDGEDRAQRSGRLLLELQKSNLGAVQPAMTFRYDETARLFVGTELGSGDGLIESIRAKSERRAILRALAGCADAGLPVPAAMQGPRTGYTVLSQRPEFPDALKGGARVKTRRFGQHIEALRQLRFLTEDSMRRANRHLVAVWTLTPEGRAECANTA